MRFVIMVARSLCGPAALAVASCSSFSSTASSPPDDSGSPEAGQQDGGGPTMDGALDAQPGVECPANAFCDAFERKDSPKGKWTTMVNEGDGGIALDSAIVGGGLTSLRATGKAGTPSPYLQHELGQAAAMHVAFDLRVDALPPQGGSMVVAQFGYDNGTLANFAVQTAGFKISEQIGASAATYHDELPRLFPAGGWVHVTFDLADGYATAAVGLLGDPKPPASPMKHKMQNPVGVPAVFSLGLPYIDVTAPTSVWFDDVTLTVR